MPDQHRLARVTLIVVVGVVALAYIVSNIRASGATPIMPEDDVSSRRVALVVAVAFALSGPLDWAFMSGMETGLMILVVLLTLWYVMREDWRGVIVAGTFAALVRPE